MPDSENYLLDPESQNLSPCYCESVTSAYDSIGCEMGCRGESSGHESQLCELWVGGV